MTMTKQVLPAALLLLAATAATHSAAAQLASPQTAIAPANLPVAAADPAIAGAISQISPEKVQQDIAKLVSFGNRSTLSSMDTDLPPGTGVTAAADWIFAEFTRISHDCGDCLAVHRDDFVEPGTPKTQRHPHPEYLRRFEGNRSGAICASRPRHRPLRLAEHGYLQHPRPRPGG
jgi:hypothetical protein